MDPRMGRRSGYHHREPDVINPQAARLHGGSRSGPPRQGYGPEFGGAGPPGRLGPSGRAPQGNAYDSEDILDDEEAQAPRRPYAGGRPRHDAEEASFADARPSARGHNNSSGRPNRGYERDSEYEHSGAFSDRRTPARGSRLNHFGDGRLDHVDDDDGALGAADARPSHRNPIRQGQGDIRRARENPEDNERYGGSRRGGGGWARDRSDDDYGNPDSRPSRALVGGRGRDEEWEGQFVQCTFAKLHPRLVNSLVEDFEIHPSKVVEWCEKGYIYVDAERPNSLNLRRLLSSLPSKDQERYKKALDRNPNMNWSARNTPGWRHAV